jgi:hypothetical protein
MKTVKVQGGKDYAMVVERVKEFNANYPENGAIIPKMLVDDGNRIVFETTIYIDGKVVGVGHNEEIRGSSQINKSSALENCETGATGRALAFGCGYMPDGSLASNEEIAQAKLQQSKIDEHLKTLQVAVDYVSGAFQNAINEDDEESILECLADMHGNQALRAAVNETLTAEQKNYLKDRQDRISAERKAKSEEKEANNQAYAKDWASKQSA